MSELIKTQYFRSLLIPSYIIIFKLLLQHTKKEEQQGAVAGISRGIRTKAAWFSSRKAKSPSEHSSEHSGDDSIVHDLVLQGFNTSEFPCKKCVDVKKFVDVKFFDVKQFVDDKTFFDVKTFLTSKKLF